jgi:elongation factor G
VHLDVKPLARGQGNQFAETVVGGAVPRQFIPSVEAGVRDALVKGPLGFPVVDVSVTLTDGQAHSVDSSDMAFRTAARQAVVEALPKCEPVLLEPILNVVITVPNIFTARVQRIITGRRGHILGFMAKADWSGWDEVTAHLPQAEVRDLIVELRSLTMGVGSFAWAYDHDQELVGRIADQVAAAKVAS